MFDGQYKLTVEPRLRREDQPLCNTVRRDFLRLSIFTSRKQGVALCLLIWHLCRHEPRSVCVLREDCTGDRVCTPYCRHCLLEICEMLVGWFESYM